MAEGKKTAFTQAQVAQAAGTQRLDSWRASGFFPPVPAPAPVAQDAGGRQFDYSQGFNLIMRPRHEENGGVSFRELRALADNYDLLRLVIETRKDQLAALSWNIVPRSADDDKALKNDERIKKIEKFLRRPDGVMPWSDWLRMLLEDMLVIDAATVYPRKNKGGDAHSWEVVDGATIKILIGEDGRIPLAPAPAYMQVIKGLGVAEFTTEELFYRPRNRRSWKHYGYSPVEQIMMTVNIALRRQLTQLNHYTEGNIPEALVSCPPEWSADDVAAMQASFDQLAGTGNLKSQLKVIPGGTNVTFTRDPKLQDQFDEWLARIVAYAFSVSPQALVQMMNRATAETAAETAQLEGLAPLQLWVQNFINDLIEQEFGTDEFMFEWDGGEELDPKTQAEIHQIYVNMGVLDTEEVRKDIGRDPRGTAQPQPNATQPNASGAPPVLPNASGDAEGGQPAPTGEAVAAAGGAPDSTSMGEGSAPAPAPVVGPDGQPISTDGAAPVPVAGAVGGEAPKVADAAMNGTQVTSLLAIVEEVAGKNLPEETAVALIMAAFPRVPKETIEAMLTPLRNFEKPTPPAPVGPDGKPIVPGQAEAPAANQDGEVPAADAEPAPGDSKKGKPPAPAVDKAEKLAKAHTHGNVKAASKQRKVLTDALKKKLAGVGASLAAAIEALPDDTVVKVLAKVEGEVDSDKAKKLLAKFDMSFEDIEEEMLSALEVVGTGAASSALNKIKGGADDALSLANTRAERYARDRAAELVKDISDSTRDMLRATVVLAESEGWSTKDLAKEIKDHYAFSSQRAQTIARTELKKADSEGALAGWKASGLQMKKEWIRSANDADCEVCEGNEMQGPIDLDDSFDSGDETSPAHPNCECVVVSVIDNEDQ